MNFQHKLLAFILIAGLVIPTGVFAKTAAVVEPAATSTQSIVTGPTLQVVPASATAVVAVTAQTSSFCNVAAVFTANLVQDTGLINFNQSANCFTVQNAQLSVPQQLAVTTAISTATVAVVDTSASNWNILHQAEPISAAVPAVPAVGLVLLAAAALLTFDPIKRTFLRQSFIFKQALTLSQLQVRRC